MSSRHRVTVAWPALPPEVSTSPPPARVPATGSKRLASGSGRRAGAERVSGRRAGKRVAQWEGGFARGNAVRESGPASGRASMPSCFIRRPPACFPQAGPFASQGGAAQLAFQKLGGGPGGWAHALADKAPWHHEEEPTQEICRLPRRRSASSSGTSLKAPLGSTSTRTHPGHTPATRPTVYRPDERSTATCTRQGGGGSEGWTYYARDKEQHGWSGYTPYWEGGQKLHTLAAEEGKGRY